MSKVVKQTFTKGIITLFISQVVIKLLGFVYRVVITGMEHGLFPRVDKVDEELEEERRLFYVGITRARDELYLTSCGFRRMYGKTEIAQPSPFLLELDKSNIEFKGGGADEKSLPYGMV